MPHRSQIMDPERGLEPGVTPVPGVVLEAPIAGRPNSWHALTRNTSEPREAIVLSVPVDPEVRQAALHALSPLRTVAGHALQAIRDVTGSRDGVAVIADRVSGTEAGGLRRLRPGQLVALGLPVARDLAALHARGLAFGADRRELSAELVVTVPGAPVLTVAGWAERRVRGTSGTMQGDVTALRGVLAAVAAPMPDRWARRWTRVQQAGDAPELARALRRLARPTTLPGPIRHRPRRAPSRLQRLITTCPVPSRAVSLAVAIAAAIAVVGAVATVGWVSAQRTGASAAAPPAPLPVTSRPAKAAAPDWAAVVTDVDRARGEVFAGLRSVDDVDEPGGSAYATDARSLQALRARGLHAAGLLPRTGSVRFVSSVPHGVVLEVRDTLPGYQLLDPAGHPRVSVPGRAERTWRVTLIDSGHGWRVASVAAA